MFINKLHLAKSQRAGQAKAVINHIYSMASSANGEQFIYITDYGFSGINPKSRFVDAPPLLRDVLAGLFCCGISHELTEEGLRVSVDTCISGEGVQQ
ncbi:hypothetical protein [Enterobacter kobei]|uniref:hypothetical protein n=1 Tax=Enterobacter kobei TaxID=208224 RepID=UPI0006824827|nr:hypothetical protein [Enterobacter kobei]